MSHTQAAAMHSQNTPSEGIDDIKKYPIAVHDMGHLAKAPDSLPKQSGLIVNADDWGRDQSNTDCIYRCVHAESVTAVSAMVFMEDSVRAAGLARQYSLDAGLHLNFTTGFSSPRPNLRLIEQQERLAACLTAHRFSSLVFHPLLQNSFEYLVRAQIDEFTRLYGKPPDRIDGHHHMHLCANLLLSPHLLPRGVIMRRNFTFHKQEKSLANRLYRRLVDTHLAKRFRLADYQLSILPLLPQRIDRIFTIARSSVVELETHPVNIEEYNFLTSKQFAQNTAGVLLRNGFADISTNAAACKV